jgi:hypothetical protein
MSSPSCSGAFGLSTSVQNNAVACFGTRTAYVAGKFVVACDNAPGATPGLRMSVPSDDVQGVVSLSVSADHSSLAAIERTWRGEQRVAFWSAELAPQPPSISMSNAHGALWDAAWAHDGNYIATATRTGAAEEAGERASLVATGGADGSAPSVVSYWRRDGSRMCEVACGHEVAKLLVDSGNSAYVITLGTLGKARILWFGAFSSF